jgi:hypothetical protein
MQNLATPLNREDSEIAGSIRKMAESICGVSPTPKKKKGLRFF